MKATYWSLVGPLAGLVVTTVSHADILNFTAEIDGTQANACVGTGSPATGVGIFTLNTDTGDVAYSITYSGLLGVETESHVHGAAQECSDAGILYPLPIGSPKNGVTVLTALQMQDMVDGLHYVNIHSDREPDGEIRGQILPVPPTTVFGLPHSPLGAALLSIDPASGNLVISNIGSSGEDGVSIDLGEANGLITEIDFGPAGALPPGAGLKWQGHHIIGPASWSMRLDEAGGGGAELFIDTTDPLEFCNRVDLLLNGEVVDSAEFGAHVAGPLVTGNIGSSGKDGINMGVTFGWWGHCNGWCGTALINNFPSTPLTISGRGTVLADSVRMFVPDGTPVRTKVSLTFKEYSPAKVQRQRTKFHGHLTESTGQSKLTGIADINGDDRYPDVTISNIGSSGLDGVRIDLPVRENVVSEERREFFVEFDPVGPPTPGSLFRFCAFGTLVGGGAVQKVSTFDITNLGPTAHALTADLAPLATTQVTVYPWNDGGWTGDAFTLPTADIGTTNSTTGVVPKISDFGLSRSLTDGAPSGDATGAILCFENDITFAPSDLSTPVLCDCLHLIAFNPGNEFEEFEKEVQILASVIPDITIIESAVRSTQYLSGLPNTNTGVTVLGWDPVKKIAIIGNIGSSGEDGVDIGTGAASGFESGLHFNEDLIGVSTPRVSISVETVVSGPELTVRFDDVGGGRVECKLLLDGLAPTEGSFEIITYRDAVVGARVEVTAISDEGAFEASSLGSSDQKLPRIGIVMELADPPPPSGGGGGGGSGGRIVVRYELFDTTSDVVVRGVNLGPAEIVEVIYKGVIPAGEVFDSRNHKYRASTDPSGSPQTAAHMLMSGHSGIMFDNRHEGTGQARHVYQHNLTDLDFLRMSNIGSSGEDGVIITPTLYGDTRRFRLVNRGTFLELRSNDNNGDNENWNFIARAAGPIGAGDDTIAGIGFILDGANRNFDVTPPSPWLHVFSIDATLYNNGVPVASATGLSPGTIATSFTSITPDRYAIELVVPPGSSTPTGVRHTIGWNTIVDLGITDDGGSTFANDLEILISFVTAAQSPSVDSGEFDIESLDFTVTALSGEVSVDILDETVNWVDTCPADTNVSGTVNVTDLLDLLAAWGPCGPPCLSDINGDGDVNVTDLLSLLAGWGACP